MAERSLFERALGLFATLSIEALCERISTAWPASSMPRARAVAGIGDAAHDVLAWAPCRGLVRGSEEAERLTLDRSPLRWRRRGQMVRSRARAGRAAERRALYVSLAPTGAARR